MSNSEAPPVRQRWRSLELIPGLVALPPAWQEAWGDQFAPFKTLCLHPATWTVVSVPCERNCGCSHSVIRRHDRTAAIGACRCDLPECPDIPLTIEEITPLKVNRQKLGRSIARALGCQPKWLSLAPHFTAQIGFWSANAIPVLFTIPSSPEEFRQTVAGLAACTPEPFILLAPTATYVDAKSTKLLRRAGARFFPLESTVALRADGKLEPLRDFSFKTGGAQPEPAAEWSVPG